MSEIGGMEGWEREEGKGRMSRDSECLDFLSQIHDSLRWMVWQW